MTKLDYSKITDACVEGIDFRDSPDFCDAFISEATYNEWPMTDNELDVLNQDSDFVYEAVLNKIY